MRIGNANPLSRNAGIIKKNVDINACCWVCETVEINNPAPSVVSRNKTEAKSSTRIFPRKGIQKTTNATMVIRITSNSPTIAKGNVLPSINSI